MFGWISINHVVYHMIHDLLLAGAISAMNAIGYIPVGEYLRLDEQRVCIENRELNCSKLKELEKYMVEQLDELRSQWGTLPHRLNSTHNYSAVTAASCYSAIGKRHNMEDDEIIIDKFCNDINCGYFGLYDGHGMTYNIYIYIII